MEYNIKKLYFNLHTFEDVINKTDSPGLPDEMQTFFEKRLIDLTGPKLIHDQLAVKRPIPKNSGKVINFRKFLPLPKATKPLTEGVTPVGHTLEETNVHTTVDQFGAYVKTTDRLENETLDNVVAQANKLIASQAGRTLDTITREVLTAGTSVRYATETDEYGTEVYDRADITGKCKLTKKVIMKAAADLSGVDAPKVGTEYVAFVHPYVAFDLMQDPGWIDVVKYKNPEQIYNGELGKIGGVRFIESTECKIIAPNPIQGNICRLTVSKDFNAVQNISVIEELEATGALATPIPVYVNGVLNSITQISVGEGVTNLKLSTAVTVTAGDMICGTGAGKDGSAVFCTMVVGEEAYGTTEIEGGGLELIVKPLGSAGAADPLNQRATVGWKATKAAIRLVEEYMVRIESGSDYSYEAVSN